MSTTPISPQNVQKIVNPNPHHMKIYKVIVVGDSNVGKTSLTYRFCEGKFLEASEATIGVDFRERTVNIEGEDIKLQLWDTAGQERFRKSMVQHYYRNVHAIVIVYDVTNKSSFDSLNHWIEECDKHCFLDIPRILVGNKCDEHMAVNTNFAQRFADQHHMPLFETSARLDSQCDNVEAIFLTLAHKLKNQKPLIPKENFDSRRLGRMASSTDSQTGCGCL
ncbi:hypothetical protein ILUMI_25846 [Ignelater luminosus]|uniref:Uncharacterized protein n=1 Tax=Ignelater luminosus TaxID=2038154 RepID=A0A8K0FZI9_IGNLU|nr:hypothetical protein ILUMI_25846 [Ignelater luminosus]